MRFFKRLILFLLLVFILPALASLLVWEADASKPRSWHQANWTSAGILPAAEHDSSAAIYILSARTGRWKGAFSVHSWIVMKRAGAKSYARYDVVGWGNPLRMNAYAPDARWYSNEPEILHSIKGQSAETLIGRLESAILNYPEAQRGDYVVWPGPNSNSFIAYLLNEVPDLGLALPSNAVGRDWLPNNKWFILDPDGKNLQVSLFGVAGFAIGVRHGVEINFLGLVAGFELTDFGIKLPGFGKIAFR